MMIVWTQLEPGGASILRCPFCEGEKRIVLPQIEGMTNEMKIKTKCSCGETFYLAFDKRRHLRKRTELTGGYFHPRREYRGLVHIKDLSKSGAGIELSSERLMLTNDKLILKFNLDDDRRTYIEKEAKITRNKGMAFGLEFVGELPDQDPLCQYLQC